MKQMTTILSLMFFSLTLSASNNESIEQTITITKTYKVTNVNSTFMQSYQISLFGEQKFNLSDGIMVLNDKHPVAIAGYEDESTICITSKKKYIKVLEKQDLQEFVVNCF